MVDLTPEVSFLVAVPPAESACAVPGQRDMLLQRGDLLSLPVQVFEMVHLASYQHNVISRYSRLSCILELDMLLAQHSLREVRPLFNLCSLFVIFFQGISLNVIIYF